MDIENPQILTFEIYSSNISETYYRRYLKIPDIVANLGGVWKAFTLIFTLLNQFFTEVEKNISIINEVFVINKKTKFDKETRSKSIRFFANKNLSKSNLIRDTQFFDKKENYNVKLIRNKNFSHTIKNMNLDNKKYGKSISSRENLIKNTKSYPCCGIDSEYKINFNYEKRFSVNEKNLNKFGKSLSDESKEKIIKKNNVEFINNNSNNFCNFSINEEFLEENFQKKSYNYGVEKNGRIENYDNEFQKNLYGIKNKLQHEKIESLQNKLIAKVNEKKDDQKAYDDELNSFKDQLLNRYLELRKNKFKLIFYFLDIFKIICHTNCNKKYSKNDLQKFYFYEKGRTSVEKYFDIICMIKKFEEFSILKNCLLDDYQLKMLEVMSKPLLLRDSKIYRNDKVISLNESFKKIDVYASEFKNKSNGKENYIDNHMYRIIDDIEFFNNLQ